MIGIHPNQDELSQFVDREVHYCVSHLITHLAKDCDSEYYDDILSVCVSNDYETAAYDDGYRVEEDDEGYYIWFKPLDKEPEQSKDIFANEELAWSACCQENDYPHKPEHSLCDWQTVEYNYDVIPDLAGGFRWIEKAEREQSEEQFDDELDAWCDCCEINGIDPEQNEAYEHWIVSKWLAEKLAAKGEMISQDIFGLTVWGRTCTGQAIMLDRVIAEIYQEMQS